MAFGIEIINNNDRILIDNNYANFGYFSTTQSTATPASSYPGLAGNTTADLVVARPNTSSNGVVSRTFSVWGSVLNPASYVYYLIRRFDTLGVSQSGYGVQVYANTGNVTFTSNISKNFEIVTVGTFNSTVANAVNIAFPSATTLYSDFSKYYCIVNSTASSSFTIPFPVPTEIVAVTGYRYVWANSTHGRILIENWIQSGGGALNKRNYDFHYMIVKELS
jgi:hypothetical protein